VILLAMVGAQHAERALDGGQHAQRQDVDLHQLQAVDVVLVPLDEGAVLHRRVADRHGLVQPALGQHEAADVLRQVAREPSSSVARAMARAISGFFGSSPVCWMCSSGRPSPQLPQTVLARRR
jgi:hypothetical protein